MAFTANPEFTPKQLTATGNAIRTGSGIMGGIFVSAASSTPTITVYDGLTAAGTKIIDTFTPVAATYYPIPASFTTGLTVVISGTVSCTVLSA